MVHFIILRHGETTYNPIECRRYQGCSDAPLSENGILQSKITTEFVLKNYKFDAIYSSHLSRTHTLAKMIGDQLGMPVTIYEDLKEIDVGIFTGNLLTDIAKQYPKELEALDLYPTTAHFPGGECYDEVYERAMKSFDRIAKQNEGKAVLVVTHGGLMRVSLAKWQNVGFFDVPTVGNTSLTLFDYDDGKITLGMIGNNDHLPEELR